MNCPKCGSKYLVGFVDGTQKCTDCTWIGKEPPAPPLIEWAKSLAAYLNTQPLEVVKDRTGIKVLVSHAFIHDNKTPPPEEVLDIFLDMYIKHRENTQIPS